MIKLIRLKEHCLISLFAQGLLDDGKVNIYLQKKIIPGSEAFIILEGMVGFIEKPVSVFIRMMKPIVLGDLPEVDIPTRYLYFFLAPIPQSGAGEILRINQYLWP